MKGKSIIVTLIALTALVSGAATQLIRAGVIENPALVNSFSIVFAVSFFLLIIIVISKYLKNKQN